MPGRGRRCEHARLLLFLSPAATSAAEPLEGKRTGCQPPSRQHLPAAGTPSPASSQPVWLRLPSAVVASVLPRAGSVRQQAYLVPELPAVAGSPPPPAPHASEGPRSLCSFLEPGAREESSWITAFALARSPLQAPQSQPGSLARLGHSGPRSSPLAPALRSLPPSSSGVGEVRFGAAGGPGSSLASGARRAWVGCWRHNEWDPGTARKSRFS